MFTVMFIFIGYRLVVAWGVCRWLVRWLGALLPWG
jgi:hypothetical protein